MSEDLTLKIAFRTVSSGATPDRYEISGDANFIWEELGVLLVNSALQSLSLERVVNVDRIVKQIEG